MSTTLAVSFTPEVTEEEAAIMGREVEAAITVTEVEATTVVEGVTDTTNPAMTTRRKGFPAI